MEEDNLLPVVCDEDNAVILIEVLHLGVDSSVMIMVGSCIS